MADKELAIIFSIPPIAISLITVFIAKLDIAWIIFSLFAWFYAWFMYKSLTA